MKRTSRLKAHQQFVSDQFQHFQRLMRCPTSRKTRFPAKTDSKIQRRISVMKSPHRVGRSIRILRHLCRRFFCYFDLLTHDDFLQSWTHRPIQCSHDHRPADGGSFHGGQDPANNGAGSTLWRINSNFDRTNRNGDQAIQMTPLRNTLFYEKKRNSRC